MWTHTHTGIMILSGFWVIALHSFFSFFFSFFSVFSCNFFVRWRWLVICFANEFISSFRASKQNLNCLVNWLFSVLNPFTAINSTREHEHKYDQMNFIAAKMSDRTFAIYATIQIETTERIWQLVFKTNESQYFRSPRRCPERELFFLVVVFSMWPPLTKKRKHFQLNRAQVKYLQTNSNWQMLFSLFFLSFYNEKKSTMRSKRHLFTHSISCPNEYRLSKHWIQVKNETKLIQLEFHTRKFAEYHNDSTT